MIDSFFSISHIFFILVRQSLCNLGHQSPCKFFLIVAFEWKYPPDGPTCASSMVTSLFCSKEHHIYMFYSPNLYIYPFMRVKDATFIAKTFLFHFGKCSGVFSSCRNYMISNNSYGVCYWPKWKPLWEWFWGYNDMGGIPIFPLL